MPLTKVGFDYHADAAAIEQSAAVMTDYKKNSKIRTTLSKYV
jgi:hypothetical protein